MSRGGRKHRGRPAPDGVRGTAESQETKPTDPATRAAAMRRIARSAGAMILLVTMIVMVWRSLRYSIPGPLGATTLPPPREAPPVSRVSRADFVGAERCASCHADQFAKWAASTHGRAGGPPAADLVIAPFNGKPIRFRDAVVTPRVEAGRYEFVVVRDDDSTEIVRVDGVIGGGHMVGGGTQGFVTKRSDGTMRFVPFDMVAARQQLVLEYEFSFAAWLGADHRNHAARGVRRLAAGARARRHAALGQLSELPCEPAQSRGFGPGPRDEVDISCDQL